MPIIIWLTNERATRQFGFVLLQFCSCSSSILPLTHPPLNRSQLRHSLIIASLKTLNAISETFNLSSNVWVWVCSCPVSSVSSSHALNSIEFGQFCHLRRGFGCPIVNLFLFLAILDFGQGFVINVHFGSTPSDVLGSPAFTSASPKLTCNNFSPQVKTHLKLLCFGSSQFN